MKRAALLVTVLALCGGLTAAGIARAFARRMLDEAAEDAAFRPDEVERFLADARRVDALGVFREGGRRDAAPLLNKWVQLDGGTDRGPDEPRPWLPDDPSMRRGAPRPAIRGRPA